MKCSVCKQDLEIQSFQTSDKKPIWKCRCGQWKTSRIDISKVVFEDADTPKPTLRFVI